MTLQTWLEHKADAFDPRLRLLVEVGKSPGYSSKIRASDTVHGTRVSLDYGIGLLQSGNDENGARAAEILCAVLALQDNDPMSETYGVWPWYYEEPLAEMSPPDLNSADFVGARLAQILARHEGQLPPSLVEETKAALSHAALSIFRRNVSLG